MGVKARIRIVERSSMDGKAAPTWLLYWIRQATLLLYTGICAKDGGSDE